MDTEKQADFEHLKKLMDSFQKSGFSGLSEYEILQLMLYHKLSESERIQIVSALLAKFGSLKGVFTADYQELIQVKGVSRNIAVYILFLHELYHAYENHSFDKFRLRSLEKRKIYFINQLGMETDEVLLVVCLDDKMCVIHSGEVARGSAGTVEVSLHKMMEIVSSVPCRHVIISHNHPQGFARFSKQDITTTQYLKDYLGKLGIELVDHILVAGGRGISMQDCAEMY